MIPEPDDKPIEYDTPLPTIGDDEDPCIMTEDEWAEMLYYEGLEG